LGLPKEFLAINPDQMDDGKKGGGVIQVKLSYGLT